MVIPSYLKKGDSIAIIAPARFIEVSEIKSFQLWANANDWNIVTAPNLFGKYHQFSGTIDERVADIEWALNNQEVKAVFCARGGYGCTQLLEHIQKFDFAKNPKWWIGFSDITSLHLTLQNQDLASIHGPMVMQFNLQNEFNETNQRYLFNALTGTAINVGLRDNEILNKSDFEGQLIGGNLSLIFAHAGISKMNNQGKVLFIEDLDEYLYHIDRMICSLKMGGVFEGLKALVVGSMIEMNDHTIPFGKNAKEIILEHLGDEGFPIIFDFPAGHDKENIAMKLGMCCTFVGNTFSQI
jgi:muramoyltetrapeptide carboxypeptidase